MLIAHECFIVNFTYCLIKCKTSAGKKDAGNKDVIEINDNTDLKVDTTDEDEIKLEETCVFVNENNVSFASYKEGKPWSYKVWSVLVCLYV